MSDVPSATAPVEALDLFAELLSEAEAGTREAFFGRMAEAACRLAGMGRALVIIYDEDRREVRTVGAHGLPLDVFEGPTPTTQDVEPARTALMEDRVIEVDGTALDRLPEKFRPLLSGGPLTFTPISAGGRWVGVVVADRPAAAAPLTEAERHALWSLGKVAALAALARGATRENELSRQLEERIDLAREIHDQVIQRLFGVSLALAGDGPLPADVRARSREEVQAALGDLRNALQRPLARSLRRTPTTLREEIERHRRAHAAIDLVVTGDAEVPEGLEALAQSVLREAIRNATKHADPGRIEVRLGSPEGTFVLEVVNDGVRAAPQQRRALARGMGLRLAAFEALAHGGLVEFGPVGDRGWRVLLAVPLEEA